MARYGLFIGVDNYSDNSVNSLSCARNDAAKLFLQFSRDGYDSKLLLSRGETEQTDELYQKFVGGANKNVTVENTSASLISSWITDAVDKMHLTAGDTVVFYFSGHGCQVDHKSYFLGSASRIINERRATDTLDSFLIDDLTEIAGVQRLFIFDCCRNIINQHGRGIADSAIPRDPVMGFAGKDDILLPLVLTSCSNGQRSFEDIECGHGYFTKVLLDALKDGNICSLSAFRNKIIELMQTVRNQNPVFDGPWNNEQIKLFDSWDERTKQQNELSSLNAQADRFLSLIQKYNPSEYADLKQKKNNIGSDLDEMRLYCSSILDIAAAAASDRVEFLKEEYNRIVKNFPSVVTVEIEKKVRNAEHLDDKDVVEFVKEWEEIFDFVKKSSEKIALQKISECEERIKNNWRFLQDKNITDKNQEELYKKFCGSVDISAKYQIALQLDTELQKDAGRAYVPFRQNIRSQILKSENAAANRLLLEAETFADNGDYFRANKKLEDAMEIMLGSAQSSSQTASAPQTAPSSDPQEGVLEKISGFVLYVFKELARSLWFILLLTGYFMACALIVIPLCGYVFEFSQFVVFCILGICGILLWGVTSFFCCKYFLSTILFYALSMGIATVGGIVCEKVLKFSSNKNEFGFFIICLMLATWTILLYIRKKKFPESKRQLKTVSKFKVLMFFIMAIAGTFVFAKYNNEKTAKKTPAVKVEDAKTKGLRLYNEKKYAEAIVELKKADQKDGNILAMIGFAYFSIDRKKNEKIASDYFAKSAAAGDAVGEYYWGWALKTGYGGVKDLDGALDLLKSAKAKGCAADNLDSLIAETEQLRQQQIERLALKEAKRKAEEERKQRQIEDGKKFFAEGKKLYDQKKYIEAIKLFRKSAEQGNANGQYWLGFCYYYGRGVERDYAEAIKLFRQSAEQGNSQGQAGLGFCYYNGHGVEKDYAEAVKLFRQSADQGNVDGQAGLGACYYNGHGVEKDYAEAVKLFRQSADQGNTQGQVWLGYCYYNGHGVDKDYAEAVKWYRKSAEQGHATAQNNLGDCYFSGRGLDKDYAEAVKWYRKSAEQGNATAQGNLGFCYDEGHGVTQDYAEAVKWYRKSAEQGNAYAQRHLGHCYRYGYGVDKDYAEAVKWYRKAAKQGNMAAKKNLETLGESY